MWVYVQKVDFTFLVYIKCKKFQCKNFGGKLFGAIDFSECFTVSVINLGVIRKNFCGLRKFQYRELKQKNF